MVPIDIVKDIDLTISTTSEMALDVNNVDDDKTHLSTSMICLIPQDNCQSVVLPKICTFGCRV